MARQQYKTLLLIATIVLALFAASPAIQKLVVAPPNQELTELSILGPYHNATYPYYLLSGADFTVYLNVTNHMDSCAYYNLQVKFRNETQSAPDSFNFTSSTQPALSNSTFILSNEQSTELPISFSFNYDITGTTQLNMQSIVINGYSLDSSGTTIAYNPDKKGFFGNLFFELWMFNDSTNAFQYNQRYVSLWLNMTA